MVNMFTTVAIPSQHRQSPCNREITWQQMDTQSFLRLKATAKKPSFANPEIMQVCELHLFEARRQTLLEMPEGLRYADEDQVFAPGQTRCTAARSGGRCRSAMAPNSVLAPFCHYHLCNGGRHHTTQIEIMTDYDIEHLHWFNQARAAELSEQASQIQRLSARVNIQLPGVARDIRLLTSDHARAREAAENLAQWLYRRANDYDNDMPQQERFPGNDALYYQRENLRRVRRAVERLQQVERDLATSIRVMEHAHVIEYIELESESDEDL